jgi:hypothetical protein
MTSDRAAVHRLISSLIEPRELDLVATEMLRTDAEPSAKFLLGVLCRKSEAFKLRARLPKANPQRPRL